MLSETILIGSKKELLEYFRKVQKVAKFEEFTRFTQVGDKRDPREDLSVESQISNINRALLAMGAVFFLEITKVTPDETAKDPKAIPTIEATIKCQYIRVMT